MVQEIDAWPAGLERQIGERTAELNYSRKAFKLQNRRMGTGLDTTGHGVSIFDGKQRLVYCNQRFLDLYRLPRRLGRPGTAFEDILRGRIAANSSVGDHPMGNLEERKRIVTAGETKTNVRTLNSGEIVSITLQPLPDGGWVSTHKDITEFSRLQDELGHRAYHDALTSLPNRHLLQQR